MSMDVQWTSNIGIILCSVALIGLTLGYAQAMDSVIINATLDSELSLENSSILFDHGNKICPDNTCKMEIQDGSFSNNGLFTGSLKVENKSETSSNFTSFDFYKLFASLNLISSKENALTGEKILFYKGKLDIDNPDSVTQLSYNSKVILSPNNLILKGNATE